MALGPKDGAAVVQVLSFPMEIIRAGVAIDVSAASASHNKQVEIRTNIMIMQQVTQFYMQLIQAAQIATNPMMHPIVQQMAMDAAKGGAILMRRILDLQELQDVDNVVPNIQELINVGQQQFGPLQNALNGGSPMGPQFAGTPGLLALPAGGQGTPGFGA